MSKDLPTSSVREPLINGEQRMTESHISTNIKKEALILGVLLLNGFLLPSYLSLSYMSLTMTLMIMFQKSETSSIVANVKKWVSLIMCLISTVVLVVGVYYLVSIPVDVKKNLTEDQIRFYMSIGISFSQDKSKVDTFMTFFPKLVSIVLAYTLANIYRQNQEDPVQRFCHLTLDLKSQLLSISVLMICFASCVVQSVVQLFLFIACAVWMASNSNMGKHTKKIQQVISQFCLVFFIFSLPFCLYTELQQRLNTEYKQGFLSSMIYPPNTSVGAYSVYVSFTIVAFVLLSLVEKSKKRGQDAAATQASLPSENGPSRVFGINGEDPSIDFDSDESVCYEVDQTKPTYQPLLVRGALYVSVMITAFLIGNVLSFIMLAFASTLLFFPIGKETFNISAYLLMPSSFIYFLFLYVINLPGVISDEDIKAQPYLYYRFQYPIIEIFMMFLMYNLTCKLNSYRVTFQRSNYFQWQEERRERYWDMNSSVLQVLENYFLRFLSQAIMLGVLIQSCISVNLYNIILLYMCLFYLSMRKDKDWIYIVILFWAVAFFLADYLISQFSVARSADINSMADWMDISTLNNFDLTNLKIFAFDKVFIVLFLWVRLQLHRYMKHVTDVHTDTASEILQKKSVILNFIIDSSVVIEKIIFIITLVSMLLLVTFMPVNIVNWIFLILLFVFLVISFSIRIGEVSQTETKALNYSALALIIFSCLMIALQTIFQLIVKIMEKNGVDMKTYLKENFESIHEYSDFYGLELENNKTKVIYNFLGLSFFFIGTLILRKALIDDNEHINTEYLQEEESQTDIPVLETEKSKLQQKQKDKKEELENIISEKKKVELNIEETAFWYALLEFAEIFHYIWGIAIVALALHWKISLSMFFCFLGVVILFTKPAFFPYPKKFQLMAEIQITQETAKDGQNKEDENEGLDQAKSDEELGFERAYLINNCNDAQNELNMVVIRQKVTLLIFAVIAISIILMYPSELFYRFRLKFKDQDELHRIIFYLNWSGIYHRQAELESVNGQLGDNWGYLFILLTMFVERYLQTQLYIKRSAEVQDLALVLAGKEPSEEYKKKTSLPVREKLLVYIERKYEALISQTLRQAFECVSIFLCLVTVGYMSNTLGLIFLVFAMLTLYSQPVEIITIAASFNIVIQYLFCILNLTNLTAPDGFPKELNDYMKDKSAKYAIPVDDLANNSNFSFDSWLYSMDDSQKNGIWIVFAQLFLLSYYMRVYKLPFNVLIIPTLSTFAIDAIKNDRLEQIEKKRQQCEDKGLTILETKQMVDSFKEIINQVSPKIEYEEIKKSSSTSRWTLRINFGRILSQHIFVNTFICFLIVLNTSLVSIISLPIFLYMFSKANDRQFVKNELPKLVGICLNILVVDLLIQIVMQTPFYNFLFDKDINATEEEGASYERLIQWFELIGWRIIWNRDTKPASTLNQEAFLDFVCKCGALCTLLLQYYGNAQKDVSWANWEDDVERLYDLNEQKMICMTYQFNNKKVQKIVLNQREKQHREVLIREIENAVVTFDDKEKMREPLLTSQEQPNQNLSTISPGANINKMLLGKIREAQMQKIKEIETDLSQRDEFIANHTKRLVDEMGWFTRTTQHWRNNRSEQIMFIYERNELDKYQKKAKRGLIKVGTELEEALRLDIMDWLLRKKNKESNDIKMGELVGKLNIGNKLTDFENFDLENEDDLSEEEIEKRRKKRDEPQLENMKRTQTYMKTRAGFYELFSAFVEMMIANSRNICFLLMILCHLINGALLTMFYPIMVFAYALLEETRPQKWFWNIVIYYSIAFVFLRFATQFNFGFEEYLFWMQKYYIGLEPVKQGVEMINYILCEILIICAANLAKMNLDIIGLEIRDELELESVGDAIKRFIENSTISTRIKNALKDGRELDQDDAKHVFQEMDKEAPLFKSMFGEMAQEGKAEEAKEQQKGARFSMKIEGKYNNILSSVKDHFVMLSSRSLTQEELIEQEKRKQQDELDEKVEKVGFMARNYFDRLFPSVVEQKPGRDYYPSIFTLQIFVLIYTLLFWEVMNGNAQTVGEALGSDSLGSEMVTFFCIQMLFMCVDRYLSNVKFTELKETEFVTSKEEINGKDLLKNFDITYKPDGDSLMQNEEIIKIAEELREKMRKESIAKKKQSSQNLAEDVKAQDDSFHEIRDGTLQINKTKLQKALVAKYYFHLIQLLFVHFIVFFYLPYKGNYNLHTEVYCDVREAPKADPNTTYVKAYTCNTFTSNTALIIFYLLYVWQFYLAAMQIRYGYPEIRKSNFLMYGNYEGDIKGGDLLFLYTMLPFVLEIKVLLDWTFSKTALDIYQWFKFVNLHYEVYIFRCGNYEYTKRKTGQPIGVLDKALCGGFFLAVTFTLLLAPLYLFSDLGTSLNPIIGADLNFKMEISNRSGLNSELSLFSTNLVEDINTFDLKKIYDNKLEVFFTNDETKNFVPEQIQEIKMSQYSQQLWGASPPLKAKFVKALSEKNTSVVFTLNINFERLAPSNALTASLQQEITVDAKQKQQIYDMISRDCSAGKDDVLSVKFQNAFSKLIFLDNTNVAQFIDVPAKEGLDIDMTASYSCQDYWVLSQTDNIQDGQGISFYTFNSKIAPSFLTEYTVFTIYTSFVFLFGQLLRMMFITGTERLQFQVMTYSDSILVLCEQVIISRRNGRLDREEVLYWTLMEVIRSSEMLRQFTGSTLPENRPHNKERKQLLAAQRAAERSALKTT